jgi:ABC-type transport system substrate-binding protein
MMRTRHNRRQLLLGGGALASAVVLSRAGFAPRGVAARAQDEPVRGGTLKFGQTGTPPGYDPQKWWNAAAGVGAAVIGEQLIAIDNYTGERVPTLAEAEPTVENEGTRYTFTLRPNVKFHKGYGTVTAADVKYSWERLMSPAFGAEAGALYFSTPFVGLQDFLDEKTDEISGLIAVDELTFQVELERPDSAFLPTFTYAHACIVPRKAVEEMGETFNWNPIGTGPYMLESVDPAQGARLVRNPDYWHPDQPYIDAVEIAYNVDPELSLLRIQSGEQDLMLEPVPVGSLNDVRDNPNLANQYFEGPQNDCQWLSLPTQLEPFTDVRVRKAVAMAINKEKLARVLKGLGDPATGGFFSPLSRYHSEGLALPYDPEGAKALLAEAGYADGFEAPFWGQNQPPYADMGPSIQQDLAEIGIQAAWTPMIYDEFIAKTNPGPEAMIVFAWEDAYGHGSYITDAGFTSSAIENECCNYPRWSTPEFDEMTVAAKSAGEEESIALYKEMDKIVVQDEVLWVPLLYPKRADLISARVRGFETAKYPSGQAKPFDRYWLVEG